MQSCIYKMATTLTLKSAKLQLWNGHNSDLYECKGEFLNDLPTVSAQYQNSQYRDMNIKTDQPIS